MFTIEMRRVQNGFKSVLILTLMEIYGQFLRRVHRAIDRFSDDRDGLCYTYIPTRLFSTGVGRDNTLILATLSTKLFRVLPSYRSLP